MPLSFDFESPTESNGMRLHEAVPAHRWCVTRVDLRELRILVQERVAAKRIVPTDLDQFDADDDEVGPSIYTISEQLVMPVTLQAGKPSWALMLHPDGLDCHIFVTHCWQEGAYEFIDKVLNSWPYGASNAYCCMLSNPQNLDISHLIESPGDSPFAKALHAATYMLVVPNQRTSIYSRVWCVYEAYIAYSEGKMISTAIRPSRAAGLLFISILLIQAVFAVVALVVASRVEHVAAPGENISYSTPARGSVVAVIILLFVAGALPPNAHARYLLQVAGAFGGFFTGWEVESAIRTHTEGWIGDGTLEYTVASVFGCCACATTLVGCLEWKWRREHDINKLQLLNGYSGKVREAECTVPADKERILGELEGYENDVENAIRVLLDNGISTPALRKAAKLSGKIAHAGHVNWSMLVLVLSLLLMYPTWNLAHDLELYLTGNFHPCSRCPIELEPLWLPCVDIVMVMVWVGVFWSSHADKRGFAARVMIRMTLWCTVFVKIVPEYWFWTRYIEYRTGYLMYTLGVMPLTFAMTLAGPGRTAHTPLIGPYLVQALMGNPRCLDQHLTNPLQFSSRSLRRLAV